MKLGILVLFAVLSCVCAECNIAPRHWCDSKDIAVGCGVERACIDRLWAIKAAPPVAIALYYESLCPGCREFITTQLYPTWKNLQSTGIMKVRMVPYGNAHEVQDTSTGLWNYTCQHGAEECTGNLIENCLLKATKYEFDVYFPIVYCMESASDPIAAAEKCITEGKQDWKMIDTCATGKEGNTLMHNAAMQTDALEPAHKYVPWILVNEKHTEGMQQEAQSHLAKVVCETYTGVKPKECSNPPMSLCFREK